MESIDFSCAITQLISRSARGLYRNGDRYFRENDPVRKFRIFRCGKPSLCLIQSHSIEINIGKIPFHQSGIADFVFCIAFQMMRGKNEADGSAFLLYGPCGSAKSVRIRIPLFYGNNDSRRCFFYMDGNPKAPLIHFAKAISLRQLDPAGSGVIPKVVWSMAEKIPADGKSFRPAFIIFNYSGGNRLVFKGKEINGFHVIV